MVEQLAEVGELAGPADAWRGRVEVRLVHVAQADDVLGRDAVQVAAAAAAAADDGDVQLLVEVPPANDGRHGQQSSPGGQLRGEIGGESSFVMWISRWVRRYCHRPGGPGRESAVGITLRVMSPSAWFAGVASVVRDSGLRTRRRPRTSTNCLKHIAGTNH